jgi:hypothetical protein
MLSSMAVCQATVVPWQIQAGVLPSGVNGKTAMKPETNIMKSGGGEPVRPHPPPVVHPSSEPEYDTEQLARRASKVTDVLEQILHDHHTAGAMPLEPPAPPRPWPG